MKKVLAVVLALVLALSLFGCETNSTASSEDSLVLSHDEITTETISFLGVLNNVTWESGEDIDTLLYLLWYRDFKNISMDLDQMQNFVFNADDFEECVQKYFDVGAQHLRKCEYYDSKENVYTFLVNLKHKYRTTLSKENAVQIQGDTAFVKAELSLTGDFSDTEYRLYTLKKVGDNFKYLSSESVMSSEVSNAVNDVERILSDFGEDMLLNYSFENPKQIPDFDLVTWYGYRLKAQGKSPIRAEGLSQPFYPAQEFESVVYDFFGLESEYLKTNEYYTQKYDGYIIDVALMGRPQHFYEITNVEVKNSIYKISFLLRIANNDPYACVLTAEKTDNGFRFISYINEKPEIEF